MADAFGVDVCDGAQQLVGVELDKQVGHHLLHLQILFHYAVRSVRDEVHDNIEVHFFWLISIRVKRLAHLNAVGVMEHFQDLKLSVLVSFVLEDLFDSNCLTGLSNSCLEDDSERAISNDFFSVVGEALLWEGEQRGQVRLIIIVPNGACDGGPLTTACLFLDEV